MGASDPARGRTSRQLALILGVALTTTLLSRLPAASPVHNLHVSHTRMVVDGRVAVLRTRFFRHDLENALQKYYGLAGFALDSAERSDSLFLGYARKHLVIISAGDTLAASIVTSGEEQDIWWYELQYRSDTPISNLQVINRVLFDLFADQQNILQLLFIPSGRREMLFFVSGSESYTVAL